MNSEENKKALIVPPDSGKGTIMLPPTEKNLITPPTPLTFDQMLKVSGGTDENQTPGIDLDNPPKMEVVELKDGGFVNVPENAIFKTAEEAKSFVMPKPPVPFGKDHLGSPPHHGRPDRPRHCKHHPPQKP